MEHDQSTASDQPQDVAQPQTFQLPTVVIRPSDIARLSRELEKVDAFFHEAKIRQSGAQASMPRASKLLEQVAIENKLNLLQIDHRSLILQWLEYIQKNAPVVHISFSVDPPGIYVQKIVTWLRKNVSPTVLVTIGLQPNIGAGCVMRINSKVFDFSLREHFKSRRKFFNEKMHAVVSEKEPASQGVATSNQSVQEVSADLDVQPQASATSTMPQGVAQ